MHAYPEASERIRGEIASWKRDESPHEDAVETSLLDSLTTLHKLMRLAYEDGETWIVETLEYERESVAVRAGERGGTGGRAWRYGRESVAVRASYAMREMAPQS